jgi:eukaryotic-like serine/threonine-protein kinase
VIGRTINNYEVRALIAEGGMGAVYLAEHPFLKRRAAIKFLRGSLADDEVMVARFMNEARAASAIRHPNIIDVIDVGRLPDGPPYLMMDLLEGESLGARLSRLGRLPLAEAIEVAREAADGLAAAHREGIVHRDLKPDNLFLARDVTSWRSERTKILDFGIAKLHPTASGVSPQTGGFLLGTAAYMSPEQCRGDGGDIDHRSDIYTLGTVLYHMLCGAPPFVDEAQLEIFVMHVAKAPVPPRQLNPDVPPAVEAAVLKALAKAPADRFATMAEFRDALSPHGAQTPTSLTPRVALARRRPWIVKAALAAVVLLGMGGAIWTFRPRAPVPVVTAAAGPTGAAPTSKKGRPRRQAATAPRNAPLPVTTAPVAAAAPAAPRPSARGSSRTEPSRSVASATPRARPARSSASASRRKTAARKSAPPPGVVQDVRDGRRSKKWIDKW